jgi:hypothetical protein
MATFAISMIILVVVLAGLSTIRGWDWYSWMLFIGSAFVFIVPDHPGLNSFLFLVALNIIGNGIMIWFGRRGRKITSDFLKELFDVKIANWIRTFQEWNQ